MSNERNIPVTWCRKVPLIALMLLMQLSFVACKHEISRTELPTFMVTENTETNSVELSHDGITYQLFGMVGGSNLCREKVGIRNDGSGSTVYSVKGYDYTEWILNNPAEGGFMENSFFLFKAIEITDIPSELEQYKQY